MTAATAARVNPAPKEERIALLFAEGHALPFVLERGQLGGWSRADVEAVLSAWGWRLDASGRVPRELRPPVTPGRPLSRVGSGLPPAERDVAAGALVGGVRAQLQAASERGAAVPPYARPTLTRPLTAGTVPVSTAPAARPVASLTLDELLGVGQRHKAGKVNGLARKLEAAARALREELEARRAADEEEARVAREIAALTAQLRELDAQRANLAAAIVAKGGRVKGAAGKGKAAPAPAVREGRAPAAAPAAGAPEPARRTSTSDKPINHGSWGGYLAHKMRGEEPCAECDAARGGRGRS